MIELPIVVGILGWMSTAIFWIAVIMIVVGIIKLKK